jgi:predicted nucleic acid-binding protein
MINEKYIELVPEKYKKPYLLYKEGNTELPDLFAFGSHQPILIHMLNTITKGEVLEFGMGTYSTRLLHIICTLQGRKLLSLENDPKWFERYVDCKNEWHHLEIFLTEDLLEKKCSFLKKKYAIALIDAHPGTLRQFLIENLKADYFIVHDTESEIRKALDISYNYDFSKFKHVYSFDKLFPMTSILSNLEEVNKNILTIF